MDIDDSCVTGSWLLSICCRLVLVVRLACARGTRVVCACVCACEASDQDGVCLRVKLVIRMACACVCTGEASDVILISADMLFFIYDVHVVNGHCLCSY